MKPLRLYIENFLCHEYSFLDFTQFNSALVVAKISNNELLSNGAGKTTIFKAIEYVLFNEADVNLEKIIRDDEPSCKVTLDIEVDNVEYRISRKRTRKGSSDLTLWKRTSETGEFSEVYGETDPLTDKKYWKDISGRRAADTEKDLFKLIKLNFKSFRNTIHFLQNDFSGLTKATPKDRKLILKEALNLAIYSKLEKIAKEKSSFLIKEIDKNKILLENIGDPQSIITDNKDKVAVSEKALEGKRKLLEETTSINNDLSEKLNELNQIYSATINKTADLKLKEKEFKASATKIETSIKEYSTKKSNVSKSAHAIVADLKSLKEEQASLVDKDYNQIDILNEKISTKKDEISSFKINIQNLINKVEELKIPMPDNTECKHCRQIISKEHKKNCQQQIDKELIESQTAIQNYKKNINSVTNEITEMQREVNSFLIYKQKLENVNLQISSKNKELQDKRTIFEEYSSLLKKFEEELSDKNKELLEVQENLANSSNEEESSLKEQIDQLKTKLNETNQAISSLNKEISHLSNEIAVLNYTIDLKNKDLDKKKDLTDKLLKLEKEYSIYPTLLQSLSTSGIPNLIIQNVLDDLQIEANNLLNQLKPGLQLQFSTEKTKGDGTSDDTLDIHYLFNGRERDYDQLSGAMKLSVMFSLKLGLSFILQKLIGTEIKFILLDEIDQSLDKAGVDAFADIVKFFQKDFKIFIITHNDRLKDKFSHAILVEQDINMVSRAKVVSSW